MKFDVVARFRETIQTVKSVSLSKIQRINSIILPEITIFPFLRKLDFLRSYKDPVVSGTEPRELMESR